MHCINTVRQNILSCTQPTKILLGWVYVDERDSMPNTSPLQDAVYVFSNSTRLAWVPRVFHLSYMYLLLIVDQM